MRAKCRLKTRNQASTLHIFTQTTALNTTQTIQTDKRCLLECPEVTQPYPVVGVPNPQKSTFVAQS